MHALAHHFSFPLRQFRKAPGFTLTVVLTLALGIGATTAIFSLVEGVLLRPLPFLDPDRLVLVGDHLSGGPNTPVSAREIGTYAKATTVFSSLGGYTGSAYELSGGPIPEQVHAARFTAGVLPTLGVAPILGRVFTAEEEADHQPLAVISYGLWLNRYHKDPRVLGTSIVLDRQAYSIIGVMPRSFDFPLQAGHLNQAQIWVPMSLTASELSDANAGNWSYQIVARLKDGVTLPQARVAAQIMHEFPAGMSAIHIRGDVLFLHDRAVADVRPLLRALFFAVATVLLIACANVAGLLLVRAIRRRREYAVRLTLGARSGVILRESILESLLLSVVGGLLGLGLAIAAIHTAFHLLPDSMPRIDSISIDAGVVGFAFVLVLATGALCAVAPAFAALRTNLTENLKEGSRTGSRASSHARLRSALVLSEIAIALILLTVSGAFLRSLQKMRAVDPGFHPDHVIVAGYQLPIQQYPTNGAADAFNLAAIERLTTKPGILAAAITNTLPSSGASGLAAYTVEGVPADMWKQKFAAFAITYGDYFGAMGIPLLDGRTFTMNDRADAPLVIIVNQQMARHCWPGQRAIGKRIHLGNPHKQLPWATVVGVVADTKIGSRDEPTEEQWYSSSQQPAILYGSHASGNLTNPAGGFITVRSTLPVEQVRETLRSTIADIDPLLALEEVQPMNDVVANIEAPRRFNTDLITAFATGALILTVVGIYAVVAFSVSLRMHEIAIRMALGAPRSRIAGLVLLSGAKLAVIGCGLGVLGSLALARVVRSFLFGVSATDPLVYTAGVLIVMLVALLASALPARRAASADPIVALRSV